MITPPTTFMVLILPFTILHVVHCLIELESMEIVSCANKNVCYEDKNLRIVLKASTIESTAGTGSISGIITGGQTWTDSQGEWELLESLNIDINYHDAVWEYELEDEGAFWTKAEEFCGPFFTECSSYENYVECAEKSGYGLALKDVSQCTKYAIENVEKWDAVVSIQSTHLNLEWEASNSQHSLWESNAEIYLTSVFDTSSCYQNLSKEYYVVVPFTGYSYYYFISKQYWQDGRNNFNLSVETWKTDFDCSFSWAGWHTIIPFYETDEEYQTLAGGNNVRTSMSNNQLYAFHNGFIPSSYDDIMGTFSGDCSDDTSFTDEVIERMGPPEYGKYIVSKIGILDHFELTLDLDYTEFIQMPTHAPTINPTKFPTVSPTSDPSESPTIPPTRFPTLSPTQPPTQPPTTEHPTQPPTHSPSIPPTQPPTTKLPTQSPTQPPTQPPTLSPTDSLVETFASVDTLVSVYEVPAKLEITSTSSLNITSKMVQYSIIQSIASGLNCGREYIRLDSAEFMTTISSRRLQSITENLLLEFTIFATSESEQTAYSTKLEETAIYHLILASLSNRLPDVLSIFIANTVHHCDVGTRTITIAGQHKCQSICGLNQYYDTPSNSCKDQVEFIITTTTIQTVTSGRMKYLGIGVGGWILTLCTIYAAYRCCVNGRMQSEVHKSRSSKRSVKSGVYNIGSMTDESSEFSEREFKTMKRKFSASLSRAIKPKKKKKDKRKRKVKAPLLSGDSDSETESGSSSSHEYSSESITESESGSEFPSSTETE